MNINIVTLFPEMFESLNASLIGKARENNLVNINIHNLRDYSKDKHKKCDDYPFGGGAGMVMSVQPIYDCISAISGKNAHRIFLSPQGRKLNQSIVKELSQYDELVLLCGHYEGIDERAIELCIDEEISIGDYVLTGGELPAMVLVDAICRYLPGILHNDESVVDESFSADLLEYPQYTRPQEFMGKKVPDVLISGNHQKVDEWRREQSLIRTKNRRPDLLIKENKNED